LHGLGERLNGGQGQRIEKIRCAELPLISTLITPRSAFSIH